MIIKTFRMVKKVLTRGKRNPTQLENVGTSLGLLSLRWRQVVGRCLDDPR